MKRLFDLTVEDLTASPVWRYEGGNGVEAMVVEEPRDSLTSADEEVYLAATEFVLPDSTPRLGFCFPVDDAGIEYLQPVIVTQAGHVRFWFDGAVAPEVLASQWNALGKREDEVFPLAYRCRVPVDGRTVAGTLRGVETSGGAARVSTVPGGGNGSKTAGESPAKGRPELRKLFMSSSGGIEKRIAPRRRAEMMVEFREGESLGAGVTSELSRRGMFIRSAQPPRLGPALSLTMHLPGGRTVLLKGRVVRQSDGSGIARADGFALELTEKTAEYDAFLTRLLDPRK